MKTKILLSMGLMLNFYAFGQPTTNAADPTCAAANVVSIYGGYYATNIATNYNPFWGQSGTVNTTFNPGTGNLVMAYTNFNYQGTDVTPTNLAAMEYLHLDVWTAANPSATTLQVTPINAGAGPGEILVTVPYIQNAWTSIVLPKSAFTGMTWDNVIQMKFAANGPGSAVPIDIYLDNIYFSTCGGSVTPVQTPTTNAADPTCAAANVVSIYGGYYATNIATNYNPNWGQSGTVDPAFNPGTGNLVMAYTNFNYQGTDVTPTNLSTMEYLHLDVWTAANPSATTLQVTPINAGAGPGEILVTVPYIQNAWTSIILPKSAFTGMTWDNVIQMKFAANGPGSTVPVDIYLDNIYFSTCGGSVTPVPPAQPVGLVANTPTENSIFVACGPGDVGSNNLVYRLFYAPTATAPANPQDASEYQFGTTPGDGDGVGPFGFNVTGLQAGTNYTFWLYQYNTSNQAFSAPASVNETTLGSSGGGGDPMVTFRVDMSEFTETFTLPQVKGTFNDWCLDCAPMNDLGNGIWELAIELAPGNYEYKFSSDGWDLQETLTSGSPCTVTTGEFTNRTLTVTETTTLPTVCWGSCVACGESTTRDITFRVDMSEYNGTFTTPEVNGTFNDWCGNCAAMTDMGNGIWEITIPLDEGNYEYKFSYDTWTGQENLAGAGSCVTTGEFINRTLTVSADSVLAAVCFASCDVCESASINNNELSQVNIYPNPSNGVIRVEGQITDNQYEIVVTDLQGRVVYTSTTSASVINENVDISNAQIGVYMLMIKTANSTRVERIVLN